MSSFPQLVAWRLSSIWAWGEVGMGWEYNLMSNWTWFGRGLGKSLQGEGENLFSSCLPKCFPVLTRCRAFENKVWVGLHSQVMLVQHPSTQR